MIYCVEDDDDEQRLEQEKNRKISEFFTNSFSWKTRAANKNTKEWNSRKNKIKKKSLWKTIKKDQF